MPCSDDQCIDGTIAEWPTSYKLVFCCEQYLIGTVHWHSFTWITFGYSSEDDFMRKTFPTMMSCITIDLGQPDMMPHSLITVSYLDFLHL